MSRPFSVDKLVETVLKGDSVREERDASDLMRQCGIQPDDVRGLVAQCNYVNVTDSDIEDAIGELPELLERYLPSTRIAELNDGAPPTQAERDLYRMAVADYDLEGDCCVLVNVYWVTDRLGRSIFFKSHWGDGGVVLSCGGPFASFAEIHGALDLGWDGFIKSWTSLGNLSPWDSELESYRQTSFWADLPGGSTCIRIGQMNKELDRLLRTAGQSEWAFITAFNPASVLLDADENLNRQAGLTSLIETLGYVTFAGRGVGDSRDWPAEESLLILGIPGGLAKQIGRRFGQIAIVAGKTGGPAELVWCF